jgi:hypothetical protein
LQRFFRCRRKDGANFRQRARGRFGQNLVAALIDIASTIASVSSSVSMSGGKKRPGRST